MYAIIIANAPDFNAAPYTPMLAAANLIIAADGGGNALFAANIVPHLVIGDLDSLAPAALAHFQSRGAEVQRFPSEKDETDLELAILAAVARGADQIDILGAIGGRWDQGLANVAMLALPELTGQHVRLVDLHQVAFLVRNHASIPGAIDATVSLIPLTGAVHGITTQGLRYPLDDATLYYERSRGISNQITSLPAQVTVREGMLLVVVAV